MKTLPHIVAVVLAAMTLGACSAGPSAGPAGHTFIATSVTIDGAPRDLVPGTAIRVTFGADGRLGVSAGCNMMGGSYRIDAGVLHVSDAATTEMACADDRMAQDDWVFAFIGAGPTVALAGDDLTLAGGNTVIRLTDKEIVEPDLSLVGPTWTVDSLIAGDAVSSVPDGVVATLIFLDDGRLEVATGCNQGGGRYEADDDTLRFSDLVLTKMACDGATGAMESAVLAVLGAESVSYTIDASSLTLRAGVGGLVLQGS